MIEETELTYREEQRFTLWLNLLIALSMVWISQKNYIINTDMFHRLLNPILH